MKDIWNKFTAWLSGWPESKAKKEREEDFLFVEEEEIDKAVKESQARKEKKPKGLKPKKKKTRKQGNMK